MFQHTAARRRLPHAVNGVYQAISVSTHSRAEAAALEQARMFQRLEVSTHSRAEAAATLAILAAKPSMCFNTQPRGGGCSLHKKVRKISELNTVFR